MCWGNCVSKIFWHCMQGKQTFFVDMATNVKEIFSQLKSKYFFTLIFFTKRFGTWDIFSIVCISMATKPKIWTCTNIFCDSVNFSFISIYWQIFKVVLFYLPKIYCFKEKGVIMKSSYVIWVTCQSKLNVFLSWISKTFWPTSHGRS